MAHRRAEAGYNLVILVVAITVLSIVMATALPLWSTAIQREKEEELIFRGLQYAEAIRVFQRRFGRFPVRLEELVEVEPRSIRQLWKDPMSESGEWGLIFATAPGANPNQGQQQDANGRPVPPVPQPPPGIPVPPTGLPGQQVTIGPIQGVYSLSDEESILTFLNENTYNKWQFTMNLVMTTVGVPNAQAQPPRLMASRWIGRPLPDFVTQALGGLQAGGAPGQQPGQALPGSGAGPGQPPGQRPGQGPAPGPGEETPQLPPGQDLTPPQRP